MDHPCWPGSISDYHGKVNKAHLLHCYIRNTPMIYFGCPKCQKAMSSPEKNAGKRVKCGKCGNVTVVPHDGQHIHVSSQTISQRAAKPPKKKKSGTLGCLGVIVLFIIIAVAVSPDSSDSTEDTNRNEKSSSEQSSPQPPKSRPEAKEFYLRIAFVNTCKIKSRQPNRKLRMWIKGFGDFYPAVKTSPSGRTVWSMGGNLIEKAGPFAADTEHTLHFYTNYPDESNEVLVPFKYSREMNKNGSPRDMLTITVTDDKIVAAGLAIKNSSANRMELVFDKSSGQHAKQPTRIKTTNFTSLFPKAKPIGRGMKLIGKWHDRESAFPGTIVFTIENNQIFMAKTYEDGNKAKNEFEVKKQKGQIRLYKKGKHNGDYFVILPDGKLGWGDELEGIWAKSTPMK